MATGNGGGARPGNIEIYSCNTQGAGNIGYVIGEIRRSNVVMLQESGRPEFVNQLTVVHGLNNVFQGTFNFGTRSRPDNFHVAYYLNGRCSLMVMVSESIAPVAVAGLVYGPGGAGGGLRPILTLTAGGTTFGSLHAPSGNHAAAIGVVNNQLNQLDMGGGGYIVAGDFNSDAAAQTLVGGRTGHVPPGATHQAGNVLDGAVSSVGITGNLENAANRGSDHFGIRGRF